ncbi:MULTISPECIES: hypothetical protein [Stenotrophomonas]|uniref:hypothetical protein n=1 Tax=Stenotrophomonas pavanii TaxID=487698 RepID=UPI0012B09053
MAWIYRIAAHGDISLPPPAAIVGLRACIGHLPGVQRALIQRTAYGRKPFGEFQAID